MYSLGVDVGSVSTDFVLTDENRKIIESLYLRTHGDPAGTVARGMKELKEKYRGDEIFAVGTTGAGRMLAGSILGADVVKNEITAHGVAASVLDPEVKTVIEIGGQDSKIILLEKGVIRDFAMNTVCAAGTGAFLVAGRAHEYDDRRIQPAGTGSETCGKNRGAMCGFCGIGHHSQAAAGRRQS